MVIIDTDGLIEYSKGNEKIIKKINDLQKIEKLKLTVINYEEFLYGLITFGDDDEIFLGSEFLKKFNIYQYTQKDTKIVASLRIELKKKGKMIGKYDSIIAGICISNNEKLFTLNNKDFKRINKLELIN